MREIVGSNEPPVLTKVIFAVNQHAGKEKKVGVRSVNQLVSQSS